MSPKDHDEETWEGQSTKALHVDLKDIAMRARPFILHLVQGPDAPKKYVIEGEAAVVGRAVDAAIQVPSAELSRHHMVLNKHGNQYRVLDLDSRNGVYLNGVRIHSAVLRDGDTIQLGNVVFVYTEGR